MEILYIFSFRKKRMIFASVAQSWGVTSFDGYWTQYTAKKQYIIIPMNIIYMVIFWKKIFTYGNYGNETIPCLKRTFLCLIFK